jgi:hypothetical protein
VTLRLVHEESIEAVDYLSLDDGEFSCQTVLRNSRQSQNRSSNRRPTLTSLTIIE